MALPRKREPRSRSAIIKCNKSDHSPTTRAFDLLCACPPITPVDAWEVPDRSSYCSSGRSEA